MTDLRRFLEDRRREIEMGMKVREVEGEGKKVVKEDRDIKRGRKGFDNYHKSH